ncbi:GntR family transcriptional regulator [Bacillus massilinigeriensis]|uniref:GntR family transcriptional regulator n=1 Tax=Bacillus massilionigeriensis TaxID=1805475 RepID=UPI00096B1573|nr:GntR family transcriptional regulator [Bacillus massilionigeriensis]
MYQFKQQYPIYVQLRDILRDQIENGIYLPGTAIPSENELSETYGVNRLTVRTAIEGLTKEGIVRPIQGKGVYVMGGRINRDLDTLSGFSRTLREKDSEPKINVLYQKIRKAGRKYSKIFEIEEEAEIHYIKRVCFADGSPMSIEEIFVPASIMSNLNELNVSDFSMYDLYDFYKINVTNAYQTLDIVTLDQNESRLLNINTSQAVYLFSSITYADEKTPIEYAKTYVRADLCEFTVKFSN